MDQDNDQKKLNSQIKWQPNAAWSLYHREHKGKRCKNKQNVRGGIVDVAGFVFGAKVINVLYLQRYC